MKSLAVALMALPFMAGAAFAAQPLSDNQMDGVSAGWLSISIADAEGLGGESTVLFASTATLSQVTVAGIGVRQEGASLLYKSVAGSQSASTLTTFPTLAIPGIGT
jgi:hypothetical protein